mgnify:FL=1
MVNDEQDESFCLDCKQTNGKAQIPLNIINHQRQTRSPSPSCSRNNLLRLSAGKKAKRLRFYVNNDKFFKGVNYAFSIERTRTLDALVEDLNRIFIENVSYNIILLNYKLIQIIITTNLR